MKKKRIISKFLVNIVFTLIMCSSTFVMFNILVKTTKDFQVSNISILKDAKFDSIMEAIKQISEDAHEYLIPLSENFMEEIKESCDMEQLEKDLNRGVINEEFQNLLKSYSYKKYFSNLENDKNDIFIATHDKIIADFSHDTTYEKITRRWKDEIDSFANPISARNALNKLYIQDDSIIIWERFEHDNENHRYDKNITTESMRRIYHKEGLEGLKNYQILVPVYITVDGDIFGRPDIKNGIRVENNKIIIIQEFNILEQLEAQYPNIISEKDIEAIKDEYEHMTMHLYVFGIVFTIAIIGVLVSTCTRFNSVLEQEEDYDEENLKNES